LDGDADEDFRIDGVAVDERARRTIEEPFVDDAAAEEEAAALRSEIDAAACAQLIEIVEPASNECMPVEDAYVRLDDRHHVKDVTGLRAQPIHHGAAEKPQFVVETDLEPVEDEVADTSA